MIARFKGQGQQDFRSGRWGDVEGEEAEARTAAALSAPVTSAKHPFVLLFSEYSLSVLPVLSTQSATVSGTSVGLLMILSIPRGSQSSETTSPSSPLTLGWTETQRQAETCAQLHNELLRSRAGLKVDFLQLSLMISYYAHRTVPSPVINKEASSSQWERMHRLTTNIRQSSRNPEEEGEEGL